jgi:hypothetical protein
MFSFRFSGDHEHGQFCHAGIGANGFKQLESVDVRHVPLCYNEIEIAGTQFVAKVLTVFGLTSQVASGSQQVTYDASHSGNRPPPENAGFI